MKALLVTSLSLALLLSACKKQEDVSESAPTKNTTATVVEEVHEENDGHQHSEEGDGHSHDHHSHEGHTHEHHEGKAYKCDNDKAITIAIHDHEGETEAHATIDNIEYDLHPMDGKENHFISNDEGIGDKGMIMINESDSKTVFKSLDEKETLLTCTAS